MSDDLTDPTVGNGFYPEMLPQMLPQPDPFLTRPSYPITGLGHNFVPIAPAPAAAVAIQSNIVATPNLPSGPHAASSRRTLEARIRCPIDGCTKMFRRDGDCRRHMRKHQAPKLKCIVEGCEMKFTRLDKVRDHLRQGHKMVL